MLIISIIALFTIIFGIYEYKFHLFNLSTIPIRIHVNGTRGKSSVTRLIAGGLRAGKIRTLAKTTGTKPQIIFEDGTEIPILRPGKANIKEQLFVFKQAAERKVQAIVIECMAVNPLLQKIAEKKIVQSTIGVITNVREDHLEEMGNTFDDIASSLSNTIPENKILFTTEKNTLHIIKEKAKKLNTEVKLVLPEFITDDIMLNFSYIEHKENVALALSVCEHLGIKKEIALEGMYNTTPDPGVLKIFKIIFFNKEINFVNGFAINDPNSIYIIWENLIKPENTIVIINCRADRVDRSAQLGELIGTKLKASHYILTGDLTLTVYDKAISFGIPIEKIDNMDECSVEEIFERVISLTSHKSFVFGIGNIVGFGEEIVTYFTNRGGEIDYRSDRVRTYS